MLKCDLILSIVCLALKPYYFVTNRYESTTELIGIP